MKQDSSTNDLSDQSLVTLDTIDRRILRELQRDASRSNLELARQVGTSPATCLRRVRRLVELGVIIRTVALVDGARIAGGMLVVAEVGLDRQATEDQTRFADRARAHPAVQQCYRVAAGPDFVLLTRVQDMAAWATVVDELFTRDLNVRNVKSYFVVDCVKFDLAEPVG